MIITHKHKLLLLIFILGISPIFAQKYRAGLTEVGIIVGGANYHGDLAPSIQLSETSWHAGLNIRKNVSSHFSYRGQLSAGQISGTDQNFSAYKYRNLSFKATILELSGIVEFRCNMYFNNALNESINQSNGIGPPAIYQPSGSRKFLQLAAHLFVIIGTIIWGYGDLI